MCGILAIFNTRKKRQDILKYVRKLRHRGPDASGIVCGPDFCIAHERLSIIDPVSGAQPFKNEQGILAVNGEIYNYKKLLTGEEKTRSDCEVILTNSNVDIRTLVSNLDGVFAFVLYKDGQIYAARDPIGVVPLYYGYGYDGSIAFASEMKALEGLVGVVNIFPPGHYYDDGIICYDALGSCMLKNPCYERSIKTVLGMATEKRTMSDVPWGVLLSGGLDSAIVAHLASLKHKIKTFCIGLEGSQDCVAAQAMANHIQSDHTNFTFTKEEGWDAIRDVIYHLETYDVTTIRAGVPMFLLARRIRAMGIKMVLSGEGSDEIFGGYLYFHNAPDPLAFQQECFDKIKRLHVYDCLRANKAMAAFGVECRVPFLDVDFVKYAMQIPAEERMVKNGFEKYILRKEFENDLPESIVWRQKEQFSDGVGYGWIDYLKEKTKIYESIVAKGFFPKHQPKTAEAFYYRMIFEEMFKTTGAIETVPYEDSCACSTSTASKWAGNEVHDASGRSVSVHSINAETDQINGKRSVRI